MNENAINIKNLKVRFGTHLALDNINLEIPNGTFISIIGPNGGGKSTLLKIILNLVEPTEGKIQIFNKNLNELKPGTIGYVPQIKTLDRSFPALPIELVYTGMKSTWSGLRNKSIKKEALKMLEMVGASSILNTPLSKLSGGELQRVYLARSLVRKPRILLLDEPSSGIDTPGESDISNIIELYQKESGATIIMVTHDWESAYHHSDFVLMLNCNIISYEEPKKAFCEKNMRKTFGHIGHQHKMIFGVAND